MIQREQVKMVGYGTVKRHFGRSLTVKIKSQSRHKWLPFQNFNKQQMFSLKSSLRTARLGPYGPYGDCQRPGTGSSLLCAIFTTLAGSSHLWTTPRHPLNTSNMCISVVESCRPGCQWIMVPWTLYKPHKLQLFDHSILNSLLIIWGAFKQITSLPNQPLNTSKLANPF